MCHVTFIKEPPQYLDLDRVADFSFLKGKTVMLGAVFEPFIHPKINRLIDILNQMECRLVIITNGHNLNKIEIPAIFDSNLDAITFSVDGIRKTTYEKIRVGGNFDRTVDNIGELRTAFSDRKTFFAINFTVLLMNIGEVRLAPSFWEKYDFDLIRFISMVTRGESEFIENNSIWFRREEFFQELNEAAYSIDESGYKISIGSPYFESSAAKRIWGDRVEGGVFQSSGSSRTQRLYHREFEFGMSYGMTFPCRSPFVSARVTWDGTVNLCHNIPIGNLYQNTFDEIWESRHAEEHRSQVKSGTEFCNKCDYFRFCINSHYLDVEDITNYYGENMRVKSAR
jgi:radical SAM protein with 4Fe4S-binding SPASM domain